MDYQYTLLPSNFPTLTKLKNQHPFVKTQLELSIRSHDFALVVFLITWFFWLQIIKGSLGAQLSPI
jgi:hypothetical protein